MDEALQLASFTTLFLIFNCIAIIMLLLLYFPAVHRHAAINQELPDVQLRNNALRSAEIEMRGIRRSHQNNRFGSHLNLPVCEPPEGKL